MKKTILYPTILVLLLSQTLYSAPKVYTTFLWHLQQPIYWPEKHEFLDRYQYAIDSIHFKERGQTNPLNNLEQIFGKDDRVAVYQWRIKDSVSSILWHPNAGTQTNYSGCLIENVNSLGSNYVLGYSPSWNIPLKETMKWKTKGNHPRNDIVLFTYHHALPGLIDPMILKREIQIYKEIYKKTWGEDVSFSKGFFPAEIAFSERNIPILISEGIEWTVVSNSHISRAVKNFPLVVGSGGENTEPPNRADQINPSQSNWFKMSIDRGCTPTNAYPFSMQPHYAKYVDPETGKESKIIVVPTEQSMSWKDGYGKYGTQDIDKLVHAASEEKPMLIVLSHDGDNAYGGGYSYYMENVPSFVNEAASKGYEPSTIQQFLEENPVDKNDVIHVEDGAWVNADGDMGSPTFSNWNWPLMNKNGEVDIENGWAEDERNWAVYTAAINRVLTAEQISNRSPNISKIVDPSEGGSNVEKAWHFLLGGTASGYMYYGKALDMELKPTIASNRASEFADKVIGPRKNNDQTPPSIWLPQRYPYNPGSLNFGAIYKYKKYYAPTDFWVWTFIHDVSGIDSVTFKYRIDKDGINPIKSNQNEIFKSGSEVGIWKTLPMTKRVFPKENVFNDPEIDFSVMPKYIADEYFVHVDKKEIKNVLIDYYVEASDNRGNIKKSPIQHVWIGDGANSNPIDTSLNWTPKKPTQYDTITITKKVKSKKNKKIFLHWGVNSWLAPSKIYWPEGSKAFGPKSIETPMKKVSPDTYEIKIGPFSKDSVSPINQIDFVIHIDDIWDNNDGLDYSIKVSK